MFATVAVCTYNRADCLSDAIHSIYAQDTSFPYEVLIIDNNSTDGTECLVTELTSTFPSLRYILEKTQGLSYARNRAIKESTGDVIAFIDDDGIAQDGWLEALLIEFTDPQIGIVGGRIELSYPGDRPNWITDKMEGYLSRFDEGDEIRDISDVYGCNFAVNRRIIQKLGGFNTKYGYNGDVLLPGEETDLCFRTWNAHMRVRYTPSAVVVHQVHESRLTPGWFINRIKGSAASFVKLGLCKDQPRELTRGLIWCHLNKMARRWRSEPDQVFYWELERVHISKTLADFLPGISGGFQRMFLYLKCIPETVCWTVRIIRDTATGQQMDVPPLEKTDQCTKREPPSLGDVPEQRHE
ncbi:MAG: glycosyltransferase family 2 protein [Armatimonadota bacterium]